MNKQQPNIRDLMAIPFTLIGVLLIFLVLLFFWIASEIGGKWTAETVLRVLTGRYE